jgi:RNA polymerase sigma factor (sigma-70 family)
MNSALEDPDPDSTGRPPVTAPAPADPHVHPDPPLPHPVDTAAFTAFYRRSAPRLVAFLCWHGARLPDAAECAQEALTQAFQRWSAIDHPYAWCRLVASRLYARRVASLEELTEDVETAGSPLIAPGTDIADFEQRHDFLRLLARLPARQRQVMAWTYDGATPTEIAAALGISPGSVRGSLKKARAALRTHLHDNRGEIQ